MNILWTPSKQQIKTAQSTQFIEFINKKHTTSIIDFHDLYDWSVKNDLTFWSTLWDFLSIKGEKGSLIQEPKGLFHQRRFFPNGSLNFAQHYLQKRNEKIAITFWGEDKVKQKLTYNQLYDQVSQVIQFLVQQEVKQGDRVVGILPNIPQTIVAMLATTAIGAIWASASPDFGEKGLIERFQQVKPKVLFVTNGYFYKGKEIECCEKYNKVINQISDIKTVVSIDYTNMASFDLNHKNINHTSFSQILSSYSAETIVFKPFSFNHPVYILFSSGTTGTPKCIVHCAGGVLLQHMKELKLHADIKPDEKLFYFTTCGWMMWNWLVSGLAVGAQIMLYDGYPFYNKMFILMDYIQQEKITHFGTSAKYIDALNKLNLFPMKTHNLSSLRSVFSTGSPLSVSGYDFVYQKMNPNVCLSSISGGTDIVSCFALGSAVLPVYRGQIQTRGLGLAVTVLDENQKPITNQQGELTCTKPFPCMPINFWNDENDKKYLSSYFSENQTVWTHGDYVSLTTENGMIFYGRSDSTLNPGGVRIGTAEIYRQLDKISEIQDAVVIGQKYEDDVRVVLFVQLKPKFVLDNNLIQKIKQKIKKNTTPRHVPDLVLSVKDIPKTKSGKIIEIAVRDVVNGYKVKNLSSLANPESLEFFTKRDELS